MTSWLINWDAILFLPPRFAKLHSNIQSGWWRNSTLPKAMQGQILMEVLTNTKKNLGFTYTFYRDRLLMGISLQTESVHPQTYKQDTIRKIQNWTALDILFDVIFKDPIVCSLELGGTKAAPQYQSIEYTLDHLQLWNVLLKYLPACHWKCLLKTISKNQQALSF